MEIGFVDSNIEDMITMCILQALQSDNQPLHQNAEDTKSSHQTRVSEGTQTEIWENGNVAQGTVKQVCMH